MASVSSLLKFLDGGLGDRAGPRERFTEGLLVGVISIGVEGAFRVTPFKLVPPTWCAGWLSCVSSASMLEAWATSGGGDPLVRAAAAQSGTTSEGAPEAKGAEAAVVPPLGQYTERFDNMLAA